MGYSMDFVIPQGPTGPAGVMSYGGMYDDTPQTIDDVGSLTQVPLTQTLPSLDITYGTNSINLNSSGIYEINYQCNLSVSAGSVVTLVLRNNGTEISESTIIRRINDDYNYIFSGNVILQITGNSIIDMAITTSNTTNVTFADGANSAITVKKIG